MACDTSHHASPSYQPLRPFVNLTDVREFDLKGDLPNLPCFTGIPPFLTFPVTSNSIYKINTGWNKILQISVSSKNELDFPSPFCANAL